MQRRGQSDMADVIIIIVILLTVGLVRLALTSILGESYLYIFDIMFAGIALIILVYGVAEFFKR